MVWRLEIRSTADWEDIRYRDYTTSAAKAEAFRKIPRVSFTDSGHGLVPTVREHHGRREPIILTMGSHVAEHLKVPKRLSERERIVAWLRKQAAYVDGITLEQAANSIESGSHTRESEARASKANPLPASDQRVAG